MFRDTSTMDLLAHHVILNVKLAQDLQQIANPAQIIIIYLVKLVLPVMLAVHQPVIQVEFVILVLLAM